MIRLNQCLGAVIGKKIRLRNKARLTFRLQMEVVSKLLRLARETLVIIMSHF